MLMLIDDDAMPIILPLSDYADITPLIIDSCILYYHTPR